MPHSTKTKLKVVSLVGLSLLVVATSWLYSRTTKTVDHLVKQAGSAPPHQAALLYSQVLMLHPHDDTIAGRLTDAELADGHVQAAIDVLVKQGTVSDLRRAVNLQLQTDQAAAAWKTFSKQIGDKATAADLVLGSQIQLELSNHAAALQLAKRAVDASNSSTDSQIQLGVVQLMAGQTVTITSMAAQTALQPLQASPAALAAWLYDHGLVSSTTALLRRQAGLDSLEQVLLARSLLSGQPSANQLQAVKFNLQTAVKQDPANLQLHQLLEQVYSRLNDPAATAEQTLIKQLHSGQI